MSPPLAVHMKMTVFYCVFLTADGDWEALIAVSSLDGAGREELSRLSPLERGWEGG